jgi:hypothetical protein
MSNSFSEARDKNSEPASDINDLYMSHDMWYFKTGEGKEVGPFRYRSEAQSNLEKLLESIRNRVVAD